MCAPEATPTSAVSGNLEDNKRTLLYLPGLSGFSADRQMADRVGRRWNHSPNIGHTECQLSLLNFSTEEITLVRFIACLHEHIRWFYGPPSQLSLLRGAGGTRVAVLRNLRNNFLLQLAEGDTHDGWTLDVVNSNSATFSRGEETTELPLDPDSNGS